MPDPEPARRALNDAHVLWMEGETHTEEMRMALERLERALLDADGTQGVYDIFKKVVKKGKEAMQKFKDARDKKNAAHEQPQNHHAAPAAHTVAPEPHHQHAPPPAHTEKVVLELPEKYLNQMERMMAMFEKLVEVLVVMIQQEQEQETQEEEAPEALPQEEGEPTQQAVPSPVPLRYFLRMNV